MSEINREEILKRLWEYAKEGCVDGVENWLRYAAEGGATLPENEVRMLRLTAYELGYEENLENIKFAIESFAWNTYTISNVLLEAKRYKVDASEIRKGRKITKSEVEELFPDYEVKRIKGLIEGSVRNMNRSYKQNMNDKQINEGVESYYKSVNKRLYEVLGIKKE